MKALLQRTWPLFFIIALFIACSLLIQSNKDVFLAVLSGIAPKYVIALYFSITLATVLIPFTSVLPFVPLAVLALGWQMTAFITALAWTVGAQILFELSRSFARPYILKLIPRGHVERIGSALNKKGLPQALFVRMMIHDNFVNVAFGIFTSVSRWEFLLVTVLAVGPSALLYAYIGALPFEYELLIAALGLVAFLCSISIDSSKASIRRWLKHRPFLS